MVVGGLTEVEGSGGRKMVIGFAGNNIVEICGHSKRMVPERGRNASVEKEGAQYVIECPNLSFGFAILRRCMRAG